MCLTVHTIFFVHQHKVISPAQVEMFVFIGFGGCLGCVFLFCFVLFFLPQMAESMQYYRTGTVNYLLYFG